MKAKILTAVASTVLLFGFILAGVTNFDRLVLGSGNYDTDPNTTADITLQNDEYISNATDGTMELNAATLNVNGTVAGTNVFTTTAAADTVVISGTLTTDIFIVTGVYTTGSVDQQDVLEAYAKTDTLIVIRLASGESALKYNWIRLR